MLGIVFNRETGHDGETGHRKKYKKQTMLLQFPLE